MSLGDWLKLLGHTLVGGLFVFMTFNYIKHHVDLRKPLTLLVPLTWSQHLTYWLSFTFLLGIEATFWLFTLGVLGSGS